MDHCVQEKRKTNPRETANLFSYFTFGYTLELFKKGFNKDLEEEDLYEVIKRSRSKECGDKTENQWKTSTSLYNLLWKRFGKTFIIIAALTIAWKETYHIVLPYTKTQMITYFQKGQTEISQSSAYYCGGTVILLNIFNFLISQNIFMYEFTLATDILASLRSLLYRKALKLSPASFLDTGMGNIVTILTKDIKAMEENLWLVMDLVVYIMQFATSCYLLWWKLGNPAFIGIGILFVALPIQCFLSNLLTKMQLKVGKNTDERIQITQEILSAIKIIKMYTWEKFFNDLIAEKRTKEVTVLMRAFYIHMVILIIGIFTSKVTFLILILSYNWMGYTINTEVTFYVLSIFHQINFAFGIVIPWNLAKIAEFRAAFIRLNKLLQMPEIEDTEESVSGKPSIYLNDINVHIKDKEILSSINLKVLNPGLTLVTGTVGSGKSSLLKTILQQYPRSKGDLEVRGTISYASQDPWLFPSSIKQNILFGEEYDAKRYQEVVRACALTYDLSLLEKGDETVVADRGLNLSKGQQCRVNLARAVYRSSDIYLLDDSLTALDGHVQDFIFRECIKKFLGDKLCVLVTQNVNHLKQADSIVVMDQGRILISETPDNVLSTKINGITNMLEENEKNETTDENDKETAIFHTEQLDCKKKVYQETKKVGKVEFDVYKKYYNFGGGLILISFLILLYTVNQICDSSAQKLITQWIDLQQNVIDLAINSTVNETYYESIVSKKDDTFSIYTILVILTAAMAFVKYYALFRFCRNASIHIHQMMSSRVVNAVMSFFDTHFIGNILNRFSLDLNNIDESMPSILPSLIYVLFSCIGSIVLIAIVYWIFLIPALVLTVILIVVRRFYIPTARSLKRLESATRSPLVGHINSSLEGLTTIRAFKAEQILKDEFDRHQDLYMSSFFMRGNSAFAFAFFMDFISCIFTTIVIVRFLFFEHDFSAGTVGLALGQVFVLTHSIQRVVNMWAALESHMTSVERALEFTDIKQESIPGNSLKNWPTEGGVRYENVSLDYESSRNPVLKNISFSVKPKQKIGIVGRTGAGKSSIISTLFRLYDYEGKIWVDGVDISTLSLSCLRTNIAIIPQDPILFTGTIRDNIDPKKRYTDETIWKVLERVKIKDLIPSLNFEIKEKCSSFSSGQKQLLCLARAAIGKYKIVVLDEATANMDPVTDKMLHDIIEEIFSDCTTMIIAHRLDTILNCDLVMVLDSGTLVEYDNPKKLIQDTSSVFYKMSKESKKKT